MESIVQLINKSLEKDTVDETHTLLQKPEGKFPEVLNRSAFLYHDELRKVKQEILRVRLNSVLIPQFSRNSIPMFHCENILTSQKVIN